MTDNEIIKALECCFIERDHRNCPLKQFGSNVTECRREMALKTIDLINRQKAEIADLDRNLMSAYSKIERLKKGWTADIVLTADAKAEAIKEFAERLCADRVSNDPVVIAATCLLKEMTEGTP